MRIKLTLVPKDKRCLVPLNYQYPLSASIYKILSLSSPEYAGFLHEKGYLSKDNRPLKLFTFSFLYIPGVKHYKGMLAAYNYPKCILHISSPLIEDFIQNFVIGLFENQEIQIGNKYTVGRFLISKVDALPFPEFSNTTKFKCLSPFVVSKMKVHNDKLQPHYMRPDESELSEAVRQNLIRKYETVYKNSPKNTDLSFSLDKNYIDKRGGFEKITKLITLKEHYEGEATRIKAINCPFTLSGSTELIQVAWEAGLGSHCSQGFGCVDVVQEN